MIKKENRLSGSRQVGRVLQKGFAVKTPNLACRISSGRVSDTIRLTVVVSKKVASKAVDRNKIKRRVREAFENAIVGRKGFSLVVFPRTSAKEVEFAKLLEEAKQCLEKAPSS